MTRRRRSCIRSWPPARRPLWSACGATSRRPDALRALWKDELCELLELAAAFARRGPCPARGRAGRSGRRRQRSASLWELTPGQRHCSCASWCATAWIAALLARRRRRVALARRGPRRARGWRSSSTCASRTLARARASRARAGGGRRSARARACSSRPSWPRWRRWSASELVQRRTDGRRRFVDVAHPLYGEAVRAQLATDARRGDLDAARRRGGGARRAARRRPAADRGLAAGSGRGGGRRAAGRVRPSRRWPRPTRRWPSASRGRRCRRAGASARGWRWRGRSPSGGRASEAQRLLGDLAAQAGDDARAGGGRDGFGAQPVLGAWTGPRTRRPSCEEAERLVRDDALRARADRAAGAARGRAAAARRLRWPPPRPLLRDALGGRARADDGRARAPSRRCSRAGRDGRGGGAGRGVAAGRPPAPRGVAPRRAGAARHARVRAAARRAAGRGDASPRRAPTSCCCRGGRAPAIAVEANSLGLIWLARGRVRTALRFCRESAALLRDGDAVGMLAFALAGVAQAAAQAGDAGGGARRARRRWSARRSGTRASPSSSSWRARGAPRRRGELSRARALAREAAALAQARGQDAYAVRALHDLCRLGEPATAAPELAGARRARSTGRSPRPRPRTPRRWSPRDGAALLEVAERFAAADALLVGRRGGGRRRRRAPRRRPRRRAPAPPPRAPPCGSRSARARARRRCSPRRRQPS